jgi:AraC-like DNA-binding protein
MSALEKTPGVRCRMHLASPSLRHSVRAYFSRDTTIGENGPQCHLTHIPATPYWVMMWQLHGQLSVPKPGQAAPSQPQPWRATVMGPRNGPSTAYSDGPYRFFAVVLLPGVMQELAGLEGPTWLNAQADLSEVLGVCTQALNDAILSSKDDAERIIHVEHFLQSQLRAGWRQTFCAPARLSHWLHHLGSLLWMSRACQSTRHLERRVRHLTGMTFGALKRMTRVEATLLHTWTDLSLEQFISWSAISQDHHYADQSHMCREIKEVTGFTPEVLRRQCFEADDEAFWIYRSWH